MKHMMVLALFVAVAAGGCGKKKDEAPAGGGAASGSSAEPVKPKRKMGLQTDQDCDRLGKKSSADSMAMTPPGTPDDQKAKLQALSDEAGNAIAALCKSDSWSGEAIACGLSAKDPATECKGLLTDAQLIKMEETVKAIFEKAKDIAPTAGTGEPAAGNAAPPAGSAAPPAATP